MSQKINKAYSMIGKLVPMSLEQYRSSRSRVVV